MKSHPDRTQSALSRIQDLLLRNADENRGSNDQQFRLQKAVTSTAQKVLDKMAGKKFLFRYQYPTVCLIFEGHSGQKFFPRFSPEKI